MHWQAISAARSRGRPKKPEKEAWRKRVPSAYSRFVKETFPEVASRGDPTLHLPCACKRLPYTIAA